MNIPNQKELMSIYGETSVSAERFRHLADGFFKTYHQKKAEYFTSPGRTEIIGNHTDHNGGKVIAGSINMDTIGAAYPNGSSMVRITSEGYRNEIVVDLLKLNELQQVSGTTALVAGILEGAEKYGFRAEGFDAYVTTNVIAAAGVSSSASFEMLICSIINYFFNDNKMTCTDCAAIGKYAENTRWNKASGMMDQMACAVGGTVAFDFSTSIPSYRPLRFSFGDLGYRLVIVNTGKGHADLSQEYSDIPHEMKEVAGVLGVDLLHETTLDAFLLHCGEIKNDRAALRAIHFFEENERVDRAIACIENGELKEILQLIEKSGISSWELLQNCYSLQDCSEQKVSLTLALSNVFLKRIGDGVCRVHGGGFAGVIACIVPKNETENYVRFISEYVGRENVYPMDIRDTGAVHIPCL